MKIFIMMILLSSCGPHVAKRDYTDPDEEVPFCFTATARAKYDEKLEYEFHCYESRGRCEEMRDVATNHGAAIRLDGVGDCYEW